MMDLKTSIDYFNEDDFVQKDGGLHELTVTITLCEYRNLISESVRNEETINRLQEEKGRLTEQSKILAELVVKNNPKFIRMVQETVRLLVDGEAEESAEEAEDQE